MTSSGGFEAADAECPARMLDLFSDGRRLTATRRLLVDLGEWMGARFSIRLWDGSRVALGPDVDAGLELSVAHPGVVSSLLYRPTAENLLLHYATGQLEIRGGDLLEFGSALRAKRNGVKIRDLPRLRLVRNALPLLLTPPRHPAVGHRFRGDARGRGASRSSRRFVEFHYDLSNELFALFLDPEMQYSCAEFADEDDSLERAQTRKLETICRKLRLEPGDRLLDVGCGWGGLVCHAARHHGIRAHGITLSPAQHDWATRKIRTLGLEDRASVEVRDLDDVDGSYHKLASVEMFEHVGRARLPAYFERLSSLLRADGLLLHQGIARRAKRTARRARRTSTETRLAQRYVLPGLELTDLGDAIRHMDLAGLEVRDVEGWREHYARTARSWCRRLYERRERAVEIVGAERYRLVLLSLAGMAWSFERGSNSVFQVTAAPRRR